ncbi:organic hydroperoxide resistance protein [Kangiella sp. HD9-110m-PIT-SAG07]|nr:organic hydroperoxide resistance protein [Kangiella sp. HD9-110m-PIT-SAG07]
MKQPNEIAYKTKATATGGRVGTAKSEDGKLEVNLSTPKELGGNGGDGTNPEQMFAAGYSACFIGAMQHVASQGKIDLPEDTSVTGEVGIGPTDGGFAIDVELQVSIPGMDKADAESLVDKAHQVCPYSNATRGGVDVRLKVV